MLYLISQPTQEAADDSQVQQGSHAHATITNPALINQIY